MKKIAFAALAIMAFAGGAVTAASAGGATPAECYARYPGSRGASCCNSSYGRAAMGTMDNRIRVAQLNACYAKGKRLSSR